MKANKAKKNAAGLAWHPDFRVVAALPDTKAIRTGFLVNAASFLLLAVAVWALVTREAALNAVTGDAERLQAELSQSRPRYNEALRQQTEFGNAEKKLAEVVAFASSPVVTSELLAQFSRTLPRLIAIDVIERKGDMITLRGTIMGASERATGIANAYLDDLNADAYFSGRFENIRLNNINRDVRTNRLFFEVGMRLKAKS